ncbi:hypothetical protein [Roseibium aggregatum]|uniref:Uncharacterized protein n=1 Tax=Roseibium aggregatum TaxID=187304 RepID=A0A939J6K6_9HYPH|nr:hypothetical protein [Roseibium aggregatum]MBN9673380.1 hypothetical protein [Roseibium aggregatum]
MSGSKPPTDKQREEALGTLKRVHSESETIAGSTFVRMADRAKDHLSAADRDEDDRIEVWGTRIGRGAGVVFAIGLVIYLVITYL